MIELACELPTSQLERFSPMLDLDFVLAHKVLTDEKYAAHYRNRPQRRIAILDNSTHEFGKPLPFADLERACRAITADVLIAPDIVKIPMPDGQFAQNTRWLIETAEAMQQSGLDTVQLGAVFCGDTYEQRRRFEHACIATSASVLCLTFHNPDRIEQWWKPLVERDAIFLFDRVHILGMHTHDELKQWVEISEEWSDISFSFDTSKPFKFGLQGIKLNTITNLRGGQVRSKEVLEHGELTEEQIECCTHNLEYLRSVCRGKAAR